jgi:hypothetical protein
MRGRQRRDEDLALHRKTSYVVKIWSARSGPILENSATSDIHFEHVVTAAKLSRPKRCPVRVYTERKKLTRRWQSIGLDLMAGSIQPNYQSCIGDQHPPSA